MPTDWGSPSNATAEDAVEHEWIWSRNRTGPPSLSVLGSVAELENCERTTLPPLADAIDPSSLDALFPETDAGVDRVRFQYCGYEVTVSSSVVALRPLD